jgi:hypothetical protein
MLGRITSVDRLTSFCALALGPLLGGVCAQQFGVQHSILGLLITLGLITAVATMAGHKWR